jgi:hypothetical protein
MVNPRVRKKESNRIAISRLELPATDARSTLSIIDFLRFESWRDAEPDKLPPEVRRAIRQWGERDSG